MRRGYSRKALLIGLAPLIMVPQLSSAETLTAAVNKACIFHPEAHTASILVSEAKERVRETRSTILPQVNGVTEFGLTEEFGRDGTALDNGRPVSLRLSLDQPLYLGGRGRAAIKSAKHELRSQQFQSVRQILSVQLSAVQAYVDLARAHELLRVRQENLAVLEKRRHDAQRRFELDAGTKTDIVQARARIERGQAEIIGATRDIREAEAAFNEAIGGAPEGEIMFPTAPPMPGSVAEALDRAGMINPDVKASEALMDAADQNVKTVQKTWYPEFRLIGDVSAQRDTVFNGFERDDASLRLRMNVPLLAGGAAKARERRSLFAKNRAYHDRNLTLGRVRESVSSSWAQYDASKKLVIINRRLVETAQIATVSVKKEAEAGFRPNIDILDAQQELLEAQLALTQSRYDEVLAAYIVKGVIGDLGIPSLSHCSKAMPDMTSKPKRKIWEHDLGFGIKITSPDPRPRRGPRGK